MIAYKGFCKGLVCRGYQFQMGMNITPEANCAKNGFHCAENPLDCLTYYSDLDTSEYCIVQAGGDLHEDGGDSKISCTELIILKKLSLRELFLHGLAYMSDHPKRVWSGQVRRDRAEATFYQQYAIVRGLDPIARGPRGSILAFAQEDASGTIVQIALGEVDGIKVRENVWYGVDLTERGDNG